MWPLLEAIPSKEELRRVVREVKGPVLYNMVGISPIIPILRAEGHGGFYHWFWYRTTAQQQGQCGTMLMISRSLELEAQVEFLQRMKGHPWREFNVFAGFSEMKAMEEKFLPKEEVERKYQSTLGFKP